MAQAVTLDDKYLLERGRVFLTGTQALVRLPMMQRRRDAAAGLNTAGFIAGYRGSPLGGLDQQLWRARAFLEKRAIHFKPAVNEDLGATAMWGTQQVGLFPGATVDVGLLYYYYPNNQSLAGDSDYFEPYASVKTTIGPVTAKGGIAYAWSQSATGNDDNVYIYGELSGGIPGTPVSLNSHIGYSSGSLSLSGSYVDWSLGADLALGHGLTVGVKYIDTDLNQLTGIPAADKLYGSTALFSVGVAF